MAYEMKNLQGSLFKNDRKQTDKHPDYNGSCMVGGIEFWISAWIKRPNGKEPFLSLAFKEKDGGSTRGEEPQTSSDESFF